MGLTTRPGDVNDLGGGPIGRPLVRLFCYRGAFGHVRPENVGATSARVMSVDALRFATYSAAMPLPRGFVPPCLPTKAPQPPNAPLIWRIATACSSGVMSCHRLSLLIWSHPSLLRTHALFDGALAWIDQCRAEVLPPPRRGPAVRVFPRPELLGAGRRPKQHRRAPWELPRCFPETFRGPFWEAG
jgi:hypothetical protein